MELREILFEHQEHEQQKSSLAGGAGPSLSVEQQDQGCLKRRRQESQEELPAALRTVTILEALLHAFIFGEWGRGQRISTTASTLLSPSE